MKNIWEFFLGTKIIFGKGTLSKLGDELKKLQMKKPLIVTDSGLEKAGIISKVIAELNNLPFEIFSEIKPNPGTEIVNKGIKKFKSHQCDSILSVGGGSPLDTGKAIAIMINNKGHIKDYEGIYKFTFSPIPNIAIPTTVGTGSEVTRAAVITDESRQKKMGIVDLKLHPNIAILDSNLLESLPRNLVATTGADALTHALEGYLCKYSNPISDILNLSAMKIIVKNIRKAVLSSQNMEEINNMLMGSMITGMGFTNCGVGLVHAMATAVGGAFGTAHGETNAIILPHVMKFNRPAEPLKFLNIAKVFCINVKDLKLEETGMKVISSLDSLLNDINIPNSLKDIGASEEEIHNLAKKTMDEFDFKSNSRPASLEDIENLFKKSFKGRNTD